MTWELVIDGIDFGEGPRWRDGRFWFSDFHQHSISSVGDDGVRRVEVQLDAPQRPSGLGWLPDGRLLFVSMLDRRVMRVEADGSIVEHADLGAIATGNCNDMVVDRTGNAYVGNFGFDLEGGGSLVPATLALVRPDGTVESAADDLLFPNGAVIVGDAADGSATLIIGETFGARYTAFDIGADGRLSNRRVWAEVPGCAPDGCTVDADGGIWFSDALGRRVVRVTEGGEITATIDTGDNTYACMLGGPDGNLLYALTCVDAHPDASAGTGTGRLLVTEVEIPRNATDLP